jgi:hypothetical protein
MLPRSVLALGLASILPAGSTAPSSGVAPGSGATPPGVTFTLTLAQPAFGPDDLVRATLWIANASRDSVRFRFSTGCQAWFDVVSDTGPVYHQQRHVACPQTPTTLDVAPGATRSLAIGWDRADDGGAPVAPGTYHLIAYLADDNSPRVSASLELR